MLLNILVMALFSRRRQRSMDSMTNEELIQEFNKGRAEAFALIVNRMERPLFLFILKRIQNEEIARDILQDTFMKLAQHAHRYDSSSRLNAWLYTIARNRSTDYLRKRKHQMMSLDAPINGEDSLSLHHLLKDDAVEASERAEHQEFLVKLDQALQAINPDQREIFLLRNIHGLKFNEIAETLSVSENTVKSRMRYALESLKRQLVDFIPQLESSSSLNVSLSKEEQR